MGLLEGLSSLGLGNLEKLDIYEKEEKKPAPREEEEKQREEDVVREADFLFDKSYTCPICEADFKCKTVRAGKARMIGSDPDLRPKYEQIDVLKYDTVICPACGYAALSRYFKFMTRIQAKLIREGICEHYHGHGYDGDSYTYDEAIERYKLVLANAIVKKAKPSEKAYICLKTAWILRGQLENLEMDASYVKKKVLYTRQEEEYIRNAYEGFLTARSTEPFPLCGMDEATLDYLLAALATRFEEVDVAGRLISDILSSKTVNSRTKDKTRMLKEELEKVIRKKKKEQEEKKDD